VKASKSAADLISQLLSFARKGKFRSIPVNIHKLIDDVVSLLERSIDKRIKINIQLAANQPIIIGDPTQLQTSVLNIALNARDAMPEGGDLTFSTEVLKLDTHYCSYHPHKITPGYYLKISISDTGSGMAKETQKHIFEPFFTTKGIGRGTGMGLAGVYGAIRSHNGAISVYSEPGKGTEFKVYLPLPQSKRKLDKVKTSITNRNNGIGFILVVDDEEIVRNLAVDVLQEFGYKVTTCNDGAEAVEFYRKYWAQIKLVILDMVMPELSGKDTFFAMREINPKIKVIISSGYSVHGEAQELLNAGALFFLQKPFQADLFLQTITNVLQSDLKENE